MTQVTAALGLSVAIRSGPVKTAVNGTLAARPARRRRLRLKAMALSLDPPLGWLAWHDLVMRKAL